MDTKIQCVSNFLDWVEEHRFSDNGLSFELDNVYYRGQADVSWDLTPSIFREPKGREYDAIKMATLRLWKDVSNYNCLERLVYFQHYGLHTRLLDITRNPLVALYVACLKGEKNGDSDGVVYFGFCNNDYSLKEAEIIAEIASNNDFSNQIISNEMVEHLMQKYSQNDVQKFAEILCRPHFVEAPYRSNRIINQQGAFLVTPLLEIYNSNNEQENYRWIDTYLFKSGKNEPFSEDKVIIETKDKSKILMELDRFNINEATLFADTEHILRYFNNKTKITY